MLHLPLNVMQVKPLMQEVYFTHQGTTANISTANKFQPPITQDPDYLIDDRAYRRSETCGRSRPAAVDIKQLEGKEAGRWSCKEILRRGTYFINSTTKYKIVPYPIYDTCYTQSPRLPCWYQIYTQWEKYSPREPGSDQHKGMRFLICIYRADSRMVKLQEDGEQVILSLRSDEVASQRLSRTLSTMGLEDVINFAMDDRLSSPHGLLLVSLKIVHAQNVLQLYV
ncbi:hypothetical protein BDR03DRAFT_988157 [Suillus americanus]|nr:hypothetical protein BDR03DRAFT_988157 [Suillus americanus]